MTEFLESIKDFSGLINTALIITLFVTALKIFRSTILNKDAVIESLKEQIKIAELFTADNVTRQFQSLKVWYNNSEENLKKDMEKAIQENKKEYQLLLEKEINERSQLDEKYSKISKSDKKSYFQVSEDQVSGEYTIVGNNPANPKGKCSQAKYMGELNIKRSGEIFKATWIQNGNINGKGTGILVGNMLGITFKFNKSGSPREHGIVVYEFIAPEIMRGRWSVHGLENTGIEECRKI